MAGNGQVTSCLFMFVKCFALMRGACHIISNMNKLYLFLVSTVLVVLAAAATFSLLKHQEATNQRTLETTPAAAERVNVRSHDDVRREHAATLANRLFTLHLVMKQPIEASQQGLAILLSNNSGEFLADPLTGQPYQYAPDQSAMKVGEATFRVNASCDDKVSGSNGTGLIIDASSSSVAVALRLESGAFVCESNL